MIRASTMVLATAALFGIAASGKAETVLTISSWAPPNHLMTKVVIRGWAADVENATQGRVKFRMLSKHPSAPPGAFDAVREGLVDVTFTGPNYTPARHIVTELGELPGGGATSYINSVAFNRIYWRHLDKANEFKGVRLMALFTHGPGQIFTTKRPINSLADLKGLKMRTGGGAAEKLARALGVSSLVKPAPESYELLSTGVADGIFFPMESIPAFKLETIVKHVTLFPGGIYNVAFAVIMNEGKWNKLPKVDQDAILTVSGEHLSKRAGRAWDEADLAALETAKKAGLAIVEAKPEFVAEFRSKTAALEQAWIQAVAAKGVDGAKALADFRAEIAKVAAEN